MPEPLDYEPPQAPKPGIKVSTVILIAIFLMPFAGVAVIQAFRFLGILK